MVTFAELVDARFAALGHAGDAYDALSSAFEAHNNQLAAVVTGLQQSWLGVAAFEAASALANQQNDLTAAHEEMLGVGVILHEAVATFTAAQTELTAALEAARAANCTVEPDGTVTGPPMTEAEHHDRDAAEQRGILVEQIAARISQAVQAADEADVQFAGQLNALAEHGRDGSGLNITTANADLRLLTPTAKSGPKAVNAWWNGLSAAEQQTFIHDQPGVYGNLDGIPAIARNEANRIYLGQLVDQFESMPQPLSDADEQKLQGFQAIQARLDAWGNKQPPLFLLGIGDQGQGRGILAIGNPDTSTNVCAFVPGMGTTLSSIAGGDFESAYRLWDTSNSMTTASTSTIVWLGYDAPPGLGTDPHALAVMGSWRGESGGVSYDQFLAGIRSTHGSASLHLTALGHSYGSFTVGQAAQQPGGTGANDIILIGSPGTGASNASQLGVPAGHVWDGAAANDEVTQLPSKLNVGMDSALGPVLGPATGMVNNAVDPHQLWFGTDPASGQFGANRFNVADGAMWPLLQAHSQYFDQGSASLSNMAAIVTGNYSSVQLVPPR